MAHAVVGLCDCGSVYGFVCVMIAVRVCACAWVRTHTRFPVVVAQAKSNEARIKELRQGIESSTTNICKLEKAHAYVGCRVY